MLVVIPGTYVEVSGFRLLGGGTEAAAVLLNGVPAEVVVANNSYILARASFSNNETIGDIIVRSNTGSRVIQRNSWTYNINPEILSVFPTFGQYGTRVTISGTRLRGYGTELISSSLVNTDVERIISQNDTEVVLQAARGGFDCQFCAATCEDCQQGNASACTSCKPSYVLASAEPSCTTICEDGQYRFQNGTIAANISFEVQLFSGLFTAGKRIEFEDVFAANFSGYAALSVHDANVLSVEPSTRGFTTVVHIETHHSVYERLEASVSEFVSAGLFLAALRDHDSVTYGIVPNISLTSPTRLDIGTACATCDVSFRYCCC